MAHRSPGLAGAVRIDVARLYDTWMELVYPRQLNPSHVLGKWKPESPVQKLGYYGWAILGLPLVLLGYPLLLVGFATRFYASKLNTAATRLGIVGVALLSVVVWGALTAVSYVQLDLSFDDTAFLAIAGAGGVATVSAALAVGFKRLGGRAVTVLFAYPFGMTALFLPPVVAAFFVPSLADRIFPPSYELARWLLDNVLFVGGLNGVLRERYTLEGIGYAIMWFALAVPVGWLLGSLTALADFIRPQNE